MANSLATRLQSAMARHRQHKRNFERTLMRKSGVSLTAAGLGAMKRMGVKPDIKGVPWMPVVWLGATLFEMSSNNPVLQPFVAGVSDATMSIYMHDAIANKTFIAGDELAA